MSDEILNIINEKQSQKVFVHKVYIHINKNNHKPYVGRTSSPSAERRWGKTWKVIDGKRVWLLISNKESEM